LENLLRWSFFIFILHTSLAYLYICLSLFSLSTFFVASLMFNPNLDFLEAVKFIKSGHHLSHNRASKGHGSIPDLMSQTDLHHILSL